MVSTFLHVISEAPSATRTLEHPKIGSIVCRPKVTIKFIIVDQNPNPYCHLIALIAFMTSGGVDGLQKVLAKFGEEATWTKCFWVDCVLLGGVRKMSLKKKKNPVDTPN